jgi:hypothetical protein
MAGAVGSDAGQCCSTFDRRINGTQQRLPTMFIFKFYVQAGGLISYGGAKPADLPLE